MASVSVATTIAFIAASGRITGGLGVIGAPPGIGRGIWVVGFPNRPTAGRNQLVPKLRVEMSTVLSLHVARAVANVEGL